jgi:hypothetical protein
MARDPSRSDFDFTAAAQDGSAAESIMLAIVDDAFAPGAVARVVRDPGNEIRGIVVLSMRTFDDRALFFASSALELDIQRLPSVAEFRVLWVWEEGRVTSDVDGYIGLVDLSLMPSEPSTGVLEYLLARAAEESTVEIPQIGRARLLKL